MACSQTLAGLALDCSQNVGGVKAIWLANFEDVSAVTVSNDEISTITMASSAKFKKYAFRAETAYANSDLQIDPQAGTSYWQTDIYMQFSKMETAKRIEIKALSLAGVAVIVEDCNGERWFYGKDRPVFPSAGNIATGTAMGDRNGFSINLQAKDNEPAMALASGTTIPE